MSGSIRGQIKQSETSEAWYLQSLIWGVKGESVVCFPETTAVCATLSIPFWPHRWTTHSHKLKSPCLQLLQWSNCSTGVPIAPMMLFDFSVTWSSIHWEAFLIKLRSEETCSHLRFRTNFYLFPEAADSIASKIFLRSSLTSGMVSREHKFCTVAQLKGPRFGSQMTEDTMSALPLTGVVLLSKGSFLSKPQASHWPGGK